MAIAFRSLSDISYAARTNTVVTAPAGIVNGDILVLVLALNHGGAPASVTPTLPSGFTQIDVTRVIDGSSFNGNLFVAWKRASSESGSYTVTHSSASTQCVIAVYSGCIASGSPVDVYSKNTYTAGLGKTTTATSVTTTVTNTRLLFCAHDWEGLGALTPPTGMTEREDKLVYIADQAIAATGATGTRTQTNGNTVVSGSPWAAFLIALKQAVGPTAYTMPADNGQLTEAGQVARLARSRLVPFTSGTLTLAGPTVNLIYSGAGPKSMPGGIGFLTASGQTAILRRTRIMPAVQGTLTLAGQIADLDADRKIAGGLGILTLAGQANRLSYARKPAGGKGQLALAGPVVNLIYSGAGAKVLPAGLGFPVLSGRTAVLRYSRFMSADVNVAIMGGRPATLTYTAVEGDIVMPVSAGVLRMAGQSAFLDVTRIPPKPMELKFGRKVYLRRW